MDEGLWRSLAVAVNREYSSLAVVLREGDEVALLPPVSGGCVSVSSGAKAPLYSCGFMARLKPCPSELGLGVRWVGASCVARCFAHGEKRASLAKTALAMLARGIRRAKGSLHECCVDGLREEDDAD